MVFSRFNQIFTAVARVPVKIRILVLRERGAEDVKLLTSLPITLSSSSFHVGSLT